MITIQKLALEVIRLESAGTQSDDSELSQGYIELLVRQAANKMIAPMIYDNLNQDDRGTLPMLIVGYEVSVQGQNKNRYIDLPEFYQRLPFNKGLKGIAPIKDRTNEFIPRLNPAVSRSLPCADREPGQNSYFTEGLRVYFDEDMSLGKVLVKLLVVAPDSISVTDPLPIYPEMQADLIQIVRQMLNPKTIQDKKLDNNPNIGVLTP